MITLAGHGKDDRLIQVDLLHPIIEGDENYTPEYFLAPCKEFLGVIDLDPFSCAIANKTIGAVNIFTREDDALSQDWYSFNRKWVNPPYSAGLIGKAIAKTLEYAEIGETLLLVNTSSSAKWFQTCMEKCSAYLHPSKRINFDSPFRTSKGNRYDQTLFYFGDRPLGFAEALSSLGNAVQPIRKAVLVESNCIDNSLPEQKEEFAVSISGEAIVYDPDAKPIEFRSGDRVKITENRELYDLLTPICNWYSGKHLATFAVNALGHALHHAQYGRISAAVALLTDAVMVEVINPKPEVKKLKEFLFNFEPSIDAVELPVIDEAIATESNKSVANLRMDEGSISVLVEDDQSVLVEDDRYQFLLERREQLIESGASPQGVWINCGKVPHRDFKQAVWKSDKPRPEWGDKKSQYIGKFMGEEHLSAIAQHKAGQELRKVEREIKKLQVKS